MSYQEIIDILPYSDPFHFVDGIDELDDNGIKGHYTFRSDEFFYKGHFKDYPITPGVILTECIAQIGLGCFGIYLINDPEFAKKTKIALVHSEMNFFKLVYPNEKVTVHSEKIYYRFQKLKCKVKMLNETGEVICSGTISGMINKQLNEELNG